jgi:hypothetical protein
MAADIPDEDRLVVDMQSLRISEICDMEEALGVPFDEMFTKGKPKGRAMQALGWIVKRRDNPGFTFEDAGNLVIVVEKAEPDPPAPAT